MKELKTYGFTLIELVIVMAIIATLTALATFNFSQARVRARDVQRKNELKAIQNALELYKSDKMPQEYPAGDLTAALVTTYMPKLPVDPKVKVLASSWDDYSYTFVDSLHYILTACLENSGDPDATTTVCQTTGIVYQLTQP